MAGGVGRKEVAGETLHVVDVSVTNNQAGAAAAAGDTFVGSGVSQRLFIAVAAMLLRFTDDPLPSLVTRAQAYESALILAFFCSPDSPSPIEAGNCHGSVPG